MKRQPSKPAGRQMDPELANLPRGSSGRDRDDDSRGDRYGDRDRNERYERRRREEEERPPSKADENRDWFGDLLLPI